MLTHLDLFSGIGGFSLGLKRTGHYKTIGFCDNDDYCQQVLRARMKDGNLDTAPIYDDIYKIPKRLERPFLITAGFPCQPYSVAGKQKGKEDDRNLWPILYDTICRLRPRYVLLENVSNLVGFEYFSTILGELSQARYDIEWRCISASSIGALHKRNRVWIVAYSRCKSTGCEKESQEPHYKPSRRCGTKFGERNSWNEKEKLADTEHDGWTATKKPRSTAQTSNDNQKGKEQSSEPTRSSQPRSQKNISRSKKGEAVAYTDCGRLEGATEKRRHSFDAVGSDRTGSKKGENVTNADSARLQATRAEQQATRITRKSVFGSEKLRQSTYWAVEPDVGRVAHGIPKRVDRLKTLGNSIVPQIAELIGELIYKHKDQ